MRKKAPAAALIALVCAATIGAGVLLWNDSDAPKVYPVETPSADAVPVARGVQPESEDTEGDLPAEPELIDSFPAHRIRMVKDDSLFPDPYYPDNRVILSRVELASTGTGMQVSGTVLTDFDADRVPASETGIQPGQQRVTVEIELVQFDTVLKRRGGVVVDPHLVVNDRTVDAPVPGQRATVLVARTMSIPGGEVGVDDFVLPAMDKPLAPGIYALIARVHFFSQPTSIQKAIRWCSDWYGHAHVGTKSDAADQDKPTFVRVMDDPEQHDFYYNEIMNFIGKAESSCMIYVGRTLQRARVELRPPGSETPNFMIWSPMHAAAREIMDWEYQRDNAELLVDDELEGKRKADQPAGTWKSEWAQRVSKWEAEAQQDIGRIRNTTRSLIARYGGGILEQEARNVETALKAKPEVLEQVFRFQQGLTYQYWILTTGQIDYGKHEVNHPASQSWEAVKSNDISAATAKRLAKLEGGWGQAAKAERDEAWKQIPPEIREVAFAYLDRKVESDSYDPQRFCELKDGTVVLVPSRWAEFRLQFLHELQERTEPAFEKITTTLTYSNQVWPQALARAELARDRVITLAYAWEFYTRTEGTQEKALAVEADWKAEAKRLPKLNLRRYYDQAKVSPGSVVNGLEELTISIKAAVGVMDLEHAYQEARKSGASPLPGRD